MLLVKLMTYFVLVAVAVGSLAFLYILIRIRAKKETSAPVPLRGSNSKVCDWMIAWLALNRGVEVGTLSRDSLISNDEVYGGTLAATYNFRAVLCIGNCDDMKTIGHLADLVEKQLPKKSRADTAE